MPKKQSKVIQITDALDTLDCIADLEFDNKGKPLLPPKGASRSKKAKEIARKISRLEDTRGNISIMKVRGLFKMILNHLKSIADDDKPNGKERERVERMKNIMAVVGDAAKKLDKLTDTFKKKGGVGELKEYKELQHFYQKNIDRKIDEEKIGKWILGLTGSVLGKKAIREARTQFEEAKHTVVDLETVKQDTEYELLFMRKEDGSRFYSPQLIRNIKLVCDFGGKIYKREELEKFEDHFHWKEDASQFAASNLLTSLRLPLKKFYEEAFRFKDKELVGKINKAFMALMLSANAENIHSEEKNCSQYFYDFQLFLRECLSDDFYQRLLAYPPKRSNILSLVVLDVVQTTCRALYSHLNMVRFLMHQVDRIVGMIHEKSAKKKEKGLYVWSRLAYEYGEMLQKLKDHSTGPLKRVLEELEQGLFTAFDPVMQFNLPYLWYNLSIDHQKVSSLRIPTPTRQVMINKAVMTDEFKGFLLGSEKQQVAVNHLLINLQDRTSWKEASRSEILEKFQGKLLFNEHLTVVTLATDTDFYHQKNAFEEIETTEEFISLFKDQLIDEEMGYYFPAEIKKELFVNFINQAMEGIHELYFDGKKQLKQKHRQDFIALFHTLLVMKFIDYVGPTSFSLSCKDGIDLGSMYNVLMFLFLKLHQKEAISDSERRFLDLFIYGPSLLIRERIMLPDIFNRMVSALEEIENTKEQYGYNRYAKDVKRLFAPLFDKPVMDAQIEIPYSEAVVEITEAA